MAHHRGKRFRAAYEKVDRDHQYAPAEAIALVKETASTKFDETVEVHLRLGVNVRHAEEQLRGTLALPNGLGKEVTVAVFAQGDGAKAATEAGADHVGAQDLADRVSEGWTDFDLAIATPDLMGPVVSKLGRILGPQGKMPNPKVGTVTNDLAKAVNEAKAGKVEYRTDRQAIVHLTIGKASFDERRCWRTTRRWSTRSFAPGRPPPRGAICSRSPWRPRWAPASAWIRPAPERPRSWRAPRPAMARPRRCGGGAGRPSRWPPTRGQPRRRLTSLDRRVRPRRSATIAPPTGTCRRPLAGPLQAARKTGAGEVRSMPEPARARALLVRRWDEGRSR